MNPLRCDEEQDAGIGYNYFMTQHFWNQRYSSAELVYGSEPNAFLVEMSIHFPAKGHALDIAAGEGRNAVFLASRHLDTLAVDQSDVGLKKAAQLAQQRGVTLQTQVADLNDFAATPNSFDVISSIFAHMPRAVRAKVHGHVFRWLKPGGWFILEAYAPDQINRDTGGPKDPDMLASLEMLVSELGGNNSDLRFEHAAALIRVIKEGVFHTGEASVVQIAAQKPAS